MGETNAEIYEMSRLKKFMTSIQFIMQDSLRFFVESSTTDFLQLIASPLCNRVSVVSTNRLMSQPRAIDDPLHPIILALGVTQKRSLFSIELVARNGRVGFNIDLNTVASLVLSLYDKIFGVVEGLPQLEPLVLDQLFWASKPRLGCVQPTDPLSCSRRDALALLLEEGLVLLRQYLSQYEHFNARLNLDYQQFMIDYEALDVPVETMARDIQRFAEETEAIEHEIPTIISVGLFSILCEQVRSALRKNLSHCVLEVLDRRASKNSNVIHHRYLEILQKLKCRSANIEELIECRNFIKTVPEEVEKLVGLTEENRENYVLLETKRFNLSNEDFKLRWTVHSWPRRIEELVASTEDLLKADETLFLKLLQSDQEAFHDRFRYLSSCVIDMSKRCDLSKLQETVVEVNRISDELAQCQQLMLLFQRRERLFDLEPSQLDGLSQITKVFPAVLFTYFKEFEPFKHFWQTAADWTVWRERWLHGPFIDLVADDVDKSLDGAWRTMFKAVKTFKQNPGYLKLAATIKSEMEEFKPFIPLVQSLRNPGMRDRHWVKLSESLNVPLQLDQSLTLAKLLDLQLIGQLETISKISDTAGIQ